MILSFQRCLKSSSVGVPACVNTHSQATGPDVRIHNRIGVWYLIYILIIMTIILGCEGDAGNPGKNLMGSDHIAPVVEIILPAAHRNIYEQSTLEAHVQDDGEITSVEFLIDGEVFANQNLKLISSPFQVNWDCRNITIGPHFIQAIAFDEAGRRGYSPRVLIYKMSADSLPEEDSIAYFSNPKYDDENYMSDNALLWRIPDEKNQYSGFGTRFTLDRPGELVKLGINFQYGYDLRELGIWAGTQVIIEITTSENGLPAEVLDSRVHDLITTQGALVSGWNKFNLPARNRRPGSIDVPQEFIVTITLSPEAVGDTISIVTDPGARRNWHGLVRENDQWRVFDAGPRVAFNPLIWVKIEYPSDAD